MENHQSSLSWFVWVNGCQGKQKNPPPASSREVQDVGKSTVAFIPQTFLDAYIN
jgi:hypothetical protein